jgi:serine/threonine protein kinase
MKKVGNYLLVSKLGQGQFGVVYKATHQDTDETFAIKAVDKKKVNSNPKLRKLFDTEMSIMSKISHPNILHLYEYLETANNYYLVINYCNGGDLEEHVKKNQNLGEEESIYFLMQIMNGFKELHKHKIMHRDFKLANIFLHDDNIIIGDFGFAKSGADMTTTKLGSPITMAPELLNAGTYCKYTNKADLWSIGVCFFQMIFGKPPWDCKSMQELQTKVKTQSGNNLVIPSNPPTSAACKELLRNLLQPDPNKRIEWKEFFNHKLFEVQPQAAPQINMADMKQSVMFRNNEDKVKNLFNANKIRDDNKEVELEAEPENIQIDIKNAYREVTTNVQAEIEKAVNQGKTRFTHEKKMIVFIMHTCRKLRNLSKKEPEIGKAAQGFMFTGVLLMRKGIFLNDNCVKTIKDRTNTFNLARFTDFLSSPVCQKIYDEMVKDGQVYLSLQSHLQAKLKEEIGVATGIAAEIYKLSTNPNSTLNDVQQQLKIQTYWLLDFFCSSRQKFGPELQKELAIGLVHLFMSVESDVEFCYKSTEGITFDWISFEKLLNMTYITQTMERACTQYGAGAPKK